MSLTGEGINIKRKLSERAIRALKYSSDTNYDLMILNKLYNLDSYFDLDVRYAISRLNIYDYSGNVLENIDHPKRDVN